MSELPDSDDVGDVELVLYRPARRCHEVPSQGALPQHPSQVLTTWAVHSWLMCERRGLNSSSVSLSSEQHQ